ncbi:RCC1 domain-containing protein [Streptomyces sp. NPDC055013]
MGCVADAEKLTAYLAEHVAQSPYDLAPERIAEHASVHRDVMPEGTPDGRILWLSLLRSNVLSTNPFCPEDSLTAIKRPRTIYPGEVHPNGVTQGATKVRTRDAKYVSCVLLGGLMACPNATTPVAELSAWQSIEAVLCLVNEQRAIVRADPLTLNRTLSAEALRHARDSARLKWWPQDGGSIVHQNPERGSEQDRIKASGYCPDDPPRNENCYNGFYLGTGVTEITAERAVMEFWMKSDFHRKTMLNPIYNETGIAVIRGIPVVNPIVLDKNKRPILDEKGNPVPPDGGFIFVQTFGFCQEPRPMGGDPWLWGAGGYGQIGDGAKLERDVPVHPENHEGIVDLAGWYHTLAVKDDGTVWAWGANDEGQVGDGTSIHRSAPVQVPGLTHMTDVAAGGKHSLALKGDGTVWAWGRNGYGQLGDGSQTDRRQPVQVHGLSQVTAIAAGYAHSLALKEDGSVWGWGANWYGQLGIGELPGGGLQTDLVSPVRTHLDVHAVAISAAHDHSMAIASDRGQLWMWGLGYEGCLGDGISDVHYAATPIKPKPVGAFSGRDIVAAGGGHVFSCAADKQGRVWAWGGNVTKVVNPSASVFDVFPTAVRVAGLDGVIDVAIGFHFGLALKSDGRVWGWGANHFGQLGTGVLTGTSPPTRTVGIQKASAIAAGVAHGMSVARPDEQR